MSSKDSWSAKVTVFFSSLLKLKRCSLFLDDLFSVFEKEDINAKFIEQTNDIWLRDFMPIQVGPDEFVQFSLTQDYYYAKDRYKKTDPDPICEALGIKPMMAKYKGKSIYLDGGNVIRGFDKAIITEKVFKDNDIPTDILSGILKEVLKVDKIIFIPVEPGDDTGHADGMVRFVDEKTVVANGYSKADAPRSFTDHLYETLAENELNVLPVPYNPSYERIKGYQSAVGCYINFLQIGEKIFLPTFDNPINDQKAVGQFGEIFGIGNVIPVPSREIALGGGVLNCLSWEIQK